MKFLVPIDLSQNELQNARIQNLATAPTSPVKGQVYFNTASNKAMVYDGTNWVPWEASVNAVTGVKGNSESTYRTGDVNITASNIGLGNVGNFKAVSTAASQGLTTTEQSNARNNIGLGAAATYGIISDASGITSSATNLVQGKAVADYVSTAIGGVDAMRFKGTIGTGGTVTTLPTTGVKVGDTYRVITAGTYAGQTCEVGDLIIATATTPTWTVAQTNIEGAITSITGTSPISVTGSGSSRDVALSSSGVTAGTYDGGFNKEYFYIPTFTVDSYGRITSASETSMYMPEANVNANGYLPGSVYQRLNNSYIQRLQTVSFFIGVGETSASISLAGYNYSQNLRGVATISMAVRVQSIEAYDSTTDERLQIDTTVTGPTYDSSTTSYTTTITASIAAAYDHMIGINAIIQVDSAM